MAAHSRSFDTPLPPAQKRVGIVRQRDDTPPPDHDSFLEARNHGFKAIPAALERRKKKK